MAKIANTTPPAITDVPSITTLGRWLAAADARYRIADEAGVGRRSGEICADTAENISWRQECAFAEIIDTLPAVTLQDAAVQIGVA